MKRNRDMTRRLFTARFPEDSSSSGRFRHTVELLIQMIPHHSEVREIVEWYNTLENEPTAHQWSYLIEALAYTAFSRRIEQASRNWIRVFLDNIG